MFQAWRTSAQASTADISDTQALQHRLAMTLGAEWPESVDAQENGQQLILSRKGRHDRIPAAWFSGHGRAVLLLHPEGREAAQQTDQFRSLRKQGRRCS